MLTLPIKKKWFDMILSGEKKEEYRKINSYYTTRFGIVYPNDPKYADKYFNVTLSNGYRKNSPKIKCFCLIYKDYGKEEWGAEPNKLYYVLKILSVEEVSNE